MKIAKWNEKVSAMFDDASMYDSENLHCGSDSDGAYFATDKYSAFFMPGYDICTSKPSEDKKGAALPGIFHAAINRAVLASETRGKANGKQARKFTSENATVFCYEKFLRVFPKNTLFYVSAPTAPIVACIWEDGKLHTLGIVMPFLCHEENFSAIA